MSKQQENCLARWSVFSDTGDQKQTIELVLIWMLCSSYHDNTSTKFLKFDWNSIPSLITRTDGCNLLRSVISFLSIIDSLVWITLKFFHHLNYWESFVEGETQIFLKIQSTKIGVTQKKGSVLNQCHVLHSTEEWPKLALGEQVNGKAFTSQKTVICRLDH